MPERPSAPDASAAATARAQQAAALLARVALGDRAAFGQLYELTASHLLGVVLRITRHREAAEEVLQEVFVKVWRAAGSFDARLSQPMTWLTSLARNRAIDSLRRQQAQPQWVSSIVGTSEDDEHDMLQDYLSTDPGPAELLDQAKERLALQRCLGGLSRDQQQALALAFYQGQSYSEVAEHLQQAQGTVKSWLRRGMLTLKECLQRAGITGA